MSLQYYKWEAQFQHTLPPHYYWKIGDYKKGKTVKLHKELFMTFSGIWISKIKISMKKKKILNEILLNIFDNFIANEISKFNY